MRQAVESVLVSPAVLQLLTAVQTPTHTYTHFIITPYAGTLSNDAV